MIVPEHWAEARIQEKYPDREAPPRQVTVRRFGWSDISQKDAQRHANQRVRQAFDRIARGEPLPKRERKVRYNGADGLPIREQILERFDDCIITRNSYGARCLNSPDVMFADIDFPQTLTDSCTFAFVVIVVNLLAAAAVYGYSGSLAMAFCVLVISPAALMLVINWAIRLHVRLVGGNEQVVMKRVDSFAEANREWHLRVYRTPNGVRLIAMHKLFDPRSEEVERAFMQLKVDRTFVVMCQKQDCFRARLTAKPWRIGIESRLKPRGAVWPIHESRLSEYNRWISEYESSAANYSACQFIKAVGAIGKIDAKAKSVSDYHDAACKALLSNEMA
jgi:hypothetical protein